MTEKEEERNELAAVREGLFQEIAARRGYVRAAQPGSVKAGDEVYVVLGKYSLTGTLKHLGDLDGPHVVVVEEPQTTATPDQLAVMQWLYAESQWLLGREKALKEQTIDIDQLAINTLNGLLATAQEELERIRALHHTPYADEAHQGGNCVDVIMAQSAENARLASELATAREDLESLKRHEWFVGKAAESRAALADQTAPVFSPDAEEEHRLRQETLSAAETLASGGEVGCTPVVVGNLLAMYERAERDDETAVEPAPTYGGNYSYMVLRKNFGMRLFVAKNDEDALEQFRQDLPSERGEHRGLYRQVARPTETPEEEEEPA